MFRPPESPEQFATQTLHIHVQGTDYVFSPNDDDKLDL